MFTRAPPQNNSNAIQIETKKPAPTFARASYMQPPRFSEFIQRPQADNQIGATPTKHYSSPHALSRENRLCLLEFQKICASGYFGLTPFLKGFPRS
jgi:hypothetical protein